MVDENEECRHGSNKGSLAVLGAGVLLLGVGGVLHLIKGDVPSMLWIIGAAVTIIGAMASAT